MVTDDILGLSGFHPKFVKRYVNLNRTIEKAVKKYSKEIKKVFPSKKIFYMENEEKINSITEVQNFLKNNKKKVITSFIC